MSLYLEDPIKANSRGFCACVSISNLSTCPNIDRQDSATFTDSGVVLHILYRLSFDIMLFGHWYPVIVRRFSVAEFVHGCFCGFPVV